MNQPNHYRKALHITAFTPWSLTTSQDRPHKGTGVLTVKKWIHSTPALTLRRKVHNLTLTSGPEIQFWIVQSCDLPCTGRTASVWCPVGTLWPSPRRSCLSHAGAGFHTLVWRVSKQWVVTEEKKLTATTIAFLREKRQSYKIRLKASLTLGSVGQNV